MTKARERGFDGRRFLSSLALFLGLPMLCAVAIWPLWHHRRASVNVRLEAERRARSRPPPTTASFGALAAQLRSQGYVLTRGEARTPDGLVTWVKAAPRLPGTTGDRWFYTDGSGVVWYATTDFGVDPGTGRPDRELKPLDR